jgi:hypothetical protein
MTGSQEENSITHTTTLAQVLMIDRDGYLDIYKYINR